MNWIDSVERQDGKLALVVIDESGNRHSRPVAHLNELTRPEPGDHEKRLQTYMSYWTESTTAAYVSVLGKRFAATESHRVFSFRHEETEYLVPTAVILSSIFRPLRYIAPWLFRPASLELISAPVSSEDEFSANIILTNVGRECKDRASTKALYSWLWAHSTARRMWNSVYLNALEGKLGLSLPSVRIWATFRGTARHGCVAVTEMWVSSKWAYDSPDFLPSDQAPEICTERTTR